MPTIASEQFVRTESVEQDASAAGIRLGLGILLCADLSDPSGSEVEGLCEALGSGIRVVLALDVTHYTKSMTVRHGYMMASIVARVACVSCNVR